VSILWNMVIVGVCLLASGLIDAGCAYPKEIPPSCWVNFAGGLLLIAAAGFMFLGSMLF
jgi:hypothetical protein